MVLLAKLAIVVALLCSVLEVKGDPACFFTETDYQGSMVCGYGNVNLYPGQYNDAFKSVRVIPGEQVIFFRDDTFHGYSTTTERDVPDLSAIGMSGLSSYVADLPACFFTETDYEGESHCYRDRLTLPSELNNQFKSARIPEGLQVVVFTQDNYQGYGILLSSGGVSDLVSYGVGSDVSSLIVTPAY